MKKDMNEETIKGIINFNLRANGEIKRLREENEKLTRKIDKLEKKNSKEYAKKLELIIKRAKQILNEEDEEEYYEWDELNE